MRGMETEFLDLIKTFEKTAKRLETLDTTILNFKDVVEGLRQNLDELVEMVHLEEIVELSEKGSQKIQLLNQNLDQISQTYERLLHVDEFKEEYFERLTAIEDKIIRLSDREMMYDGNQKEGQASSSYIALEDRRHVYYIETETHQLMAMAKENENENGPIDGILAKKLVCENDTVFALHQETGDVFVLNGRIPMARHSLDATDFVVVGFNIYYLSDTKLMRFHLFTLEKEVILNHIVSFERLNHQLICQTEAKKSVFVNLNK